MEREGEEEAEGVKARALWESEREPGCFLYET